MYLILLAPLYLVSFQLVGVAAEVISQNLNKVIYEPSSPDPILVDDWRTIIVNLSQLSIAQCDQVWVEYTVQDSKIAQVTFEPDWENGELLSSFNVTGKFLGYTQVCSKVTIVKGQNDVVTITPNCLDISVIRESRPIDLAFTYSVAVLASVIYINMEAALDFPTVSKTLRRPIRPSIGFVAQFVLMPLLAFGIAKLLIPHPALQLGLFITGFSPGGGASNIWTLTLGGNLDLSITMTTISTFASFIMMPIWIFTLGATIFNEAHLSVPYYKIATFAVSLIVPLGVGLLIHRYLPKFTKILVKIMKPFAIFLIVFIVVFAIYTNLYLFELFTWEILLAGLLFPWLGYIFGGGMAWVLKQHWKDVIAIGIETGVQNTGLSIFALRFSLEQPEADLTTALPVAVAIMTPILPTLLLIVQKIRGTKQVPDDYHEPKDSLLTPELKDDKSKYGSFS